MSSLKKIPLAKELKKHSPVKKGTLKNEDDFLIPYNKIINRLYIGNIEAASCEDFFKKKNIKAVLNCTKDIPNFFQHIPHIEYMRIPVNDSLKQNDLEKMYEFLPAAVQFIDKHVNIQKNNILIHCYAGRQRSVCASVAFLMHKFKKTPEDACKYILQKRPEAFHYGLSLNFDKSINKYYKDLEKLKKCKINY